MDQVDQYICSQRERYERELADLLRIASVSADSAFAPHVREAAQFVFDKVQKSGLETELVETDTNPLIIGQWLHADDAPTVLIYGHYDVQPPDPLELWTTPPFEPSVRDGNIYARGATDDKGQMMTHLQAVEAWLHVEERLPVNVKVIIEGEEEVGSAAITDYLATNANRLAADYIVVSDNSMWGPDRPAITYGIRGIIPFEVIARGPNKDLHSGVFGGSVTNPANALVSMMASLVNSQGRIQLPGFYDDVVPLTDEERRAYASLGFDEAGYQAQVGVKELFGESGYSTLERRWARPTCDINGLSGGYQGEGPKTVIASEARAKVTFRLVPNQSPEKIAAAFEKHVKAHCPPGINLEILFYEGGEALLVPSDSRGIQAARRALEAIFEVEPVLIREGGSIPIFNDFVKHLGAECLLIGFGLPDDNTHSPNEKMCLKDYHRGIRSSARLLEELAKP
ncbi:Succinyl-diaminopimelate desuccinylase [Planctomycetes bacterium Pan216]|uniref:Succinyl-diaminopimelate desuccinylase n=1 Tax=Kolteria novifilia TaxID=2527975 RepID=A0A518AZB8_9BACT|nr:Succinyl-diaminopimelate desuccinylase [Planctomycetes bacterium Pan216]